MANFNELIKRYRYQVTNMDEEDYVMAGDAAAAELANDLTQFEEQLDPDMTMSIVIQAMQDYFASQLELFEKRKARKAGFSAQNSEVSGESVKQVTRNNTNHSSTTDDKLIAEAYLG